MIGWLQGERIQLWEQGSHVLLLLSCSGVGYEVQVLPREISNLKSSKEITLWVHQVIRDDGYSLFGFLSKSERELFRILIAISGIGPQMAISLLEANNANSLISAISDKDIKKLTESQGVGKKTAERIVLELRNKLSGISGIEFSKAKFHSTDISNEITSTLRNLEYKDHEINQVITRLSEIHSTKIHPSENEVQKDFDFLLKEALMLLSQKNG